MTETLTSQLLWYWVNVEADGDLVDAFRLLTNRARHDFAPHLEMQYRITRRGSTIELHDGFDHLFTAGTGSEVGDVLHTHMLRRLFEYACLCGWVRLRAACLDVDGRRTLLIGPPGSGKTTESLRRGIEGATLGGDESVLIRNGRSIAVPDRFRVTAATVEHVPGLAQAFADAPVVPGGNTVRAIDPTCAGLGWDVVERPVDAIMLLVGQPGPSRIRRAADSGMLLRQILEQTVRCVEPTRRIVAEVSKVLRSATLGTLSC